MIKQEEDGVGGDETPNDSMGFSAMRVFGRSTPNSAQ